MTDIEINILQSCLNSEVFKRAFVELKLEIISPNLSIFNTLIEMVQNKQKQLENWPAFCFASVPKYGYIMRFWKDYAGLKCQLFKESVLDCQTFPLMQLDFFAEQTNPSIYFIFFIFLSQMKLLKKNCFDDCGDKMCRRFHGIYLGKLRIN